MWHNTMRHNQPGGFASANHDDPPILKVIYHLLYSINKFVTNKSKLPQDGTQVFLYMG